MSNNPEHDDKIYERAINYMNKAQKVSRGRLTSCSLYTVQSITIVTLIQLQLLVNAFFSAGKN